ncbi:MAG TPA: protein kinase [Acidobacteriaceae bacterium]|jgi:serine/threonine-protein kinase|nr:protein kinase [Acidobacteriaceae bacterium]
MIGTRLGNYEITAILGEGGMGVVYRARDLQLERQVALKVLPPEFAGDPERRTLLEREARLLASLNHPNIAQIYGLHTSGTAQALVMELVEGPTLAEFLAGGVPTLENSLSIAIQIVQALTAAHDQGIVHRDLKPQNIKLTPGGRVKVLDFGLARRQPGAGALMGDSTTLSNATKDGIILGTVGYMAPEQVRGENVDTRADIFSFGCVLYEVVTGKRAFARPSAIETLAAILHDQPEAPSRHRDQLPSSLDRVIAHCLEKERSVRFQSARDLEFVLTAFAPAETVQAVQPRAASVAVLPFANLSADAENEYFADGITEDVIAHLARIRSLKVISRTSIMGFKKSERSLREIGEKLGAATVVEGSIRRAGNRVRIVAQLVDAHSDEHLWSDTYDRDLTDIFAIQSDVALKIATALRAQLSNEERARVGRRPTEDFEAYELYLRGRNQFCLFSAEGFRRSLTNYEAAIARDPGFALAWAGIAESYTELCIGGGSVGNSPEDTISRARAASARALEIDDQLAEAHSISGFVRFIFDYDWVSAEREFLTAIELSPGSAEAHEHYSWLCSALERYDDALREVRRARELDPLLIKSDVGTTLLRAGRIEEALEEARRSVRNDPEVPRVHSNLGWALIFHGEHAAGIASLEQAVALSPGSTLFLSQLGQAYGITGNVKGARKILETLQACAAQDFVSPYHFAYVYSGLGEADTAMDWLERAFERRSGAIYGIKGSFLFRNLHNHPRFNSLLQRMNLA